MTREESWAGAGLVQTLIGDAHADWTALKFDLGVGGLQRCQRSQSLWQSPMACALLRRSSSERFRASKSAESSKKLWRWLQTTWSRSTRGESSNGDAMGADVVESRNGLSSQLREVGTGMDAVSRYVYRSKAGPGLASLVCSADDADEGHRRTRQEGKS
jgi:hypothetical protein